MRENEQNSKTEWKSPAKSADWYNLFPTTKDPSADDPRELYLQVKKLLSHHNKVLNKNGK